MVDEKLDLSLSRLGESENQERGRLDVASGCRLVILMFRILEVLLLGVFLVKSEHTP